MLRPPLSSVRERLSKKKTFFLELLALEYGYDRLALNVGTELPLNAA
jgi:hypothetical protein